MLETFYPDEYFESTYAIDFEKYRNEGYRGILFDIDNTLVPHGEPADEQAIAFFEKLRELGYQTCLVSNNKRPRVESFAVQVGAEFVFKAGKPSRRGYEEGMQRMGTDLTNTLFVGDQLFTDVWGARRTGIRSFLVKPINPKEEIQIVLKRYLEKPILYLYERKKKND
jgi:hypothetical protein